MANPPLVTQDPSLISELKATRERFLELVDDIRPGLHRYCARMIGSVADAEDIVQDALARAYFDLSGLKELPALRAWLFRIAHNRALDELRRADRRLNRSLEADDDLLPDDNADPDSALFREQAVHVAVSRFLALVPLQRSCVILKDVLDHSLAEIAALLDLSLPAVKSALHRGRTQLKELSQPPSAVALPRPATSATLARYAELFNAHDWDGVRAMLLEDVQLDVVTVHKRTGRDKVGVYFGNYDRLSDWRVAPGWLDGHEVLAVFRPAQALTPRYFVELRLQDDKIASIRDFFHVRYIAQDARIEFS